MEYILIDLGINPDGKHVGYFPWSGSKFKLELIQNHTYYFTRRESKFSPKYVILSKHPIHGFITTKQFDEDTDFGHKISAIGDGEDPGHEVLMNDAAFATYTMALLSPDT